MRLLLPILLLACRSDGAKETDDATTEVVTGAARLHDEIESLVYVSWDQQDPATVWVEYRLVGEDWRQTPPTDWEAGSHEQLLLGLPFGTEVEYRVASDSDDGAVSGESGAITTGPVPEPLPEVTVGQASADEWDSDLNYVLVSTNEAGLDYEGPWWTVIFDRQGRYVWALESDLTRVSVYVQPTFDGTRLLIDQNSFWSTFDMGAGSQVLSVSIEGETLATHDTPGLHHPFTQIDDETLVWAAIGEKDNNNETLEALSPDGVQSRIWDCADFHGELELTDQCSANTLTWDQTSDRFLLSLWSTETVVEIDRISGATPRWFGHAPGAWGFEPSEATFWWQHGAVYTADRTLLISSKIEDEGDETVVREYALDEESETLVEVWSFGEGEGVYSEALGEAHRLPGGNTLHNFGSTARLRELTPAGSVVWEMTLGDSSYLGRATPLADLYQFAD